MITEDYVSFETSKLLKDKGFNEGCFFVINAISKNVMPVSWPTTNSDIEDEKANLIALPTLQMAMKWLREIHNIAINIGWGEIFEDKFQWWCIILNLKDGSMLRDSEYYATYEEACEVSIKYCLENLI